MFKLPPDYQRTAGSPRVLAANFAGGMKAGDVGDPFSPLEKRRRERHNAPSRLNSRLQ
ncbi:hypothetical protein NKL07_21345 [Mesorhizobium sp. C280B]|uniref:hypothetical protein n=1 Tax=unclassified Mesorhizobium TaxID=325217 RepID=UPI0012EC9A20|nr:hypothetical protein [Mesorhizobium sp. LSJC280B00]